MLLLSLYVGALIVGGGLLAASAVLGGHGHDHDVDHDLEAGVDHDADLGHDHDAGDHDHDAGGHDGHVGLGDALWMPILSLRFWTFFLAFFGLTGALLEGLARAGLVSGPWWLTLGLAVALGFGSGYAVSALVRSLKAKRVSSEVVPEVDYVGKVGEVLLDVAPGDPGHVRLEVKGVTVDLPAALDGPGERLPRGKQALVVGWERGRLQVTAYAEDVPDRGGERRREPA